MSDVFANFILNSKIWLQEKTIFCLFFEKEKKKEIEIVWLAFIWSIQGTNKRKCLAK